MIASILPAPAAWIINMTQHLASVGDAPAA